LAASVTERPLARNVPEVRRARAAVADVALQSLAQRGRDQVAEQIDVAVEHGDALLDVHRGVGLTEGVGECVARSFREIAGHGCAFPRIEPLRALMDPLPPA
jgi:hypothetical protein